MGGDRRIGLAASAHGQQVAPRPGVALALGGGGAKGIGHIPVLEVLDEMGIRANALAGTSIGAVVGACYAAGMAGRDIRAHLLERIDDRPAVLRAVFAARSGSFRDFLSSGLGNPIQIDGLKALEHLLPAGLATDFSGLTVPLTVVATDFHQRQEHAFTSGPLLPALAASIAIPGIFRPVALGPHVYIDGGATNPVPVNYVVGPDVVSIGVSVIDGIAVERELSLTVPTPWEAVLGSITLMMHTLAESKLAAAPPTVLVIPPIHAYRGFDFFKAREILEACEPMKSELKRRLERALDSSPAVIIR